MLFALPYILLLDSTIQSQTDDQIPLWDRCSAEDAFIHCKTWGKVYLWESWDDLIHSLGAYDSHDRKPCSEIELSPKNTPKTFELQEKHNYDDTSNIENVDPLNGSQTDTLKKEKQVLEITRNSKNKSFLSKIQCKFFKILNW